MASTERQEKVGVVAVHASTTGCSEPQAALEHTL